MAKAYTVDEILKYNIFQYWDGIRGGEKNDKHRVARNCTFKDPKGTRREYPNRVKVNGREAKRWYINKNNRNYLIYERSSVDGNIPCVVNYTGWASNVGSHPTSDDYTIEIKEIDPSAKGVGQRTVTKSPWIINRGNTDITFTFWLTMSSVLLFRRFPYLRIIVRDGYWSGENMIIKYGKLYNGSATYQRNIRLPSLNLAVFNKATENVSGDINIISSLSGKIFNDGYKINTGNVDDFNRPIIHNAWHLKNLLPADVTKFRYNNDNVRTLSFSDFIPPTKNIYTTDMTITDISATMVGSSHLTNLLPYETETNGIKYNLYYNIRENNGAVTYHDINCETYKLEGYNYIHSIGYALSKETSNSPTRVVFAYYDEGKIFKGSENKILLTQIANRGVDNSGSLGAA